MTIHEESVDEDRRRYDERTPALPDEVKFMSIRTVPNLRYSAWQCLPHVAVSILFLGIVLAKPAWGQVRRPSAKSTSTKQRKRVAKISQDAIRAARALAPAKGISTDLFAAEPLLANPVAIDVDYQGRVFVCETYRQEKGVEDNRNHEDWLEDDLASKSTADRLAMLKKHLGDDLSQYAQKQDRIRLLMDRNRDGRADRSTVFIDGFNDPLDGTGAGVLSRKGNIFYTCIPKLYAFRDDNNDGKAERRTTMFDGFGVRTAYRGHDLHGLAIGPDGRLYFSMGDRGFNVKTAMGRIKNVETGAVLRCELDGKNLEIVATGLRNPQDLAFDDYGNLFTCDNNSDSGDRARWLQIHWGGEYGWRMAYQYFTDRGPYNREHIWEVDHPKTPRGIIPTIANISDVPPAWPTIPGPDCLKPTTAISFFAIFVARPAKAGSVPSRCARMVRLMN